MKYKLAGKRFIDDKYVYTNKFYEFEFDSLLVLDYVMIIIGVQVFLKYVIMILEMIDEPSK